jgi:hypothetical protein
MTAFPTKAHPQICIRERKSMCETFSCKSKLALLKIVALLQIFTFVVATFPMAQTKNEKRNSTTKVLPTSLQIANPTVLRGANGKVLIAWQDGGAKESLGFNVFRETKMRLTQLNPSMIAGATFSFKPKKNEPVGGNFAWWDDAPGWGSLRTSYWIEYVGLDGQTTLHGPFTIDENNPINVEISRSRLLSELNSSDEILQQEFSPEFFTEDFARTEVGTVDAKSSESIESQSQQWILAAGVAAKISVDRDGRARVPRSALESAGVNFSNPNTIKVFESGVETAVSLSPSGDLELYGQKLDLPTTDKRVYWVANINDGQNGKRFQQINAGPFDNSIQPSFFTSTIERKDRSIRSNSILNGDTENFYGAIVGSSPVSQSVFINGLNQGATEQVTLTIAIQGMTLQAHNVLVKLNGSDVGSVTLSDRENVIRQFQVPHSMLREGKNVFTLTGTATGSDFTLVDFIRVAYSRQYKALNNRLRFSTQNNQAVRVNNFTSSQIKVWDITDPMNTKEMIVSPQSNGDGTFSFTLPSGTARNFLAEATNATQYQPPVVANETSTLNANSNAANFVIISYGSFKTNLEPLRVLRQSQGLTTKIVDIEDVYDEFDFSRHGPTAIKSFLNHARMNWQTAPQYVLLVGDGHYDPKDYIASGGFSTDLVPSKLVDSLFTETASDDWFVDFDNDGIAEMALGRIAIRTPNEATTVVNKLLSYENQPAGSAVANGGLLVSDEPVGYDFESFTSQVRATLPPAMPITTINRSQMDATTARAQIISNINSGKGIVNYLGHGTLSSWSSPPMLSNTDAAALTNTNKLAFFVALTCLNGAFIEPSVDSLAEAAQKAPNGGAIGVWGSSGLTFPFGQVSISLSFYPQVFAATPARVGDAIKQSKSATTDMDIRRLTVFLGDPTMRLR